MKHSWTPAACCPPRSARILNEVTEELIRKRSEHNEGEISTLEEISLHQEDIEKIEHIQNWCRNLQILLLQSNLIARIENLSKLKKLEYLNLALNNIELIENLEACESLQKLDLTLNFIGQLQTVESLKNNIHLHTLYLTGNPCTDYKGYRQFVVASLPQLRQLDGTDIERSERILAVQVYKNVKKSIKLDQKLYQEKREKQKQDNELKAKDHQWSQPECYEDPEKVKQFWSETCDHSPETRVHLALEARKSNNNKDLSNNDFKNEPACVNLFDKEGKPRNVNEAKVPFTLKEEDGCYILDITVFRYLDTALIDVDIQPQYVTVLIKGKTLQLTLLNEVEINNSTAKRSQATGHLIITMPQVNGMIMSKKKQLNKKNSTETTPSLTQNSKRELLEIGPPPPLDFANIVNIKEIKTSLLDTTCYSSRFTLQEKKPQEDYIEDPDVPPLE
ncbi:dynein axonemal assembly factor 11 isoform X1 [Schistocerca serialis cubense]|uniref:dynein axonemal assembly factor 11 isoform X1 n=1 Tax=Schistocerca serialis cubense TaxID=2023355 RepID=UPI00214ED0FD|nr:dynein axonemal assembly factor 11 isoform X1 [Schistocerca serialis cubense]